MRIRLQYCPSLSSTLLNLRRSHLKSDKSATRSFHKRETQLQHQLQHHQDQMFSLFPSLEGLSIPDNKASLPSSYRSSDLQHEDYQQWVEYEFELRVGMGHDYLEDLRQAVGLNHYISRRIQKSARGLDQMQKASKQRAVTSRHKQAIIANYIRNWQKISGLLETGHISARAGEDRLKGLQKLDSKDDIQFFEEWGSQTTSYMGHQHLNVTWIWRVAMVEQPSHISLKNESVKKLTDNWESEGI